METLIRPSDHDLSISIRSEQNKNTITIPCFLHTKDCDGLYEVIFAYLKGCNTTEKFITEINAEAEDFAPFKRFYGLVDDLVDTASKTLDVKIAKLQILLKAQEIDLKYGPSYRDYFIQCMIDELDKL